MIYFLPTRSGILIGLFFIFFTGSVSAQTVWVPGRINNVIDVWDMDSNHLFEIDTAADGVIGPNGIAVDLQNGRIFVVGQFSNNIAQYDASTGVLHSVHDLAGIEQPYHLHVDPAQNLLFVASPSVGVCEYDLISFSLNTTWTESPIMAPVDVLYNSNSAGLAVLSGALYRDNDYLSLHAMASSSGDLVVEDINPEFNDWARGFDFDDLNKRIFVVYMDAPSGGNGAVRVFDTGVTPPFPLMHTWQSSQISQPTGVCYLRGLDHLFVSTNSQDEVLKLDAATGNQIGSFSNNAMDVSDVVVYWEPCSINGIVYEDVDADGQFDMDELGMAGVLLELWRDDGSGIYDPEDRLVGKTNTDADGNFAFQQIVTGGYFVNLVDSTVQAGYGITTNNDPTLLLELEAGTETLSVDFGFAQLFDFGDAEDSTFPVTLADNGARHGNCDLYFGSSIDFETNSRQEDNFDDGIRFLGSRLNIGDDFELPFIPGNQGAVEVTIDGSARDTVYAHAWFDWNRDGDWDESNECVFADVVLQCPSFDTITFQIPENISAGNVWTRFRLSTEKGVSFIGDSDCGEVEDYYLEGAVVPVELSFFHIFETKSGIRLEWATQSETENLGFNILRGCEVDGRFEQVNAQLIPGAGNSEVAQNYFYLDAKVESRKTYIYKLKSVSYSGLVNIHGPISITTGKVPAKFLLEQNFPNPFSVGGGSTSGRNPETSIAFSIEKATEMKLTITNARGEIVRTLVDGVLTPGRHTFVWNGKDNDGKQVSSGVLFYTLYSKDNSITRKMMLIR